MAGPVHRMLQFGLSNAARDVHHATEADRAADPDHSRINRGDEALWPAALSQIFLAGLFAGEFNLKLAECRREGRTRHP